MKPVKKLIAAMLSFCIILGLVGCGSLKEPVIDGFNHWLQFNSKHALTEKKDLQGKKTNGKDTYVGSYTAEYKNFSGEEYLFGGTGLERENGNELTASYTIKITSGSVSLIWVHSGNEYTITDVEGEDTREFTLGSGDNYIVLRGNNFCGGLDLEVK